MNNIIVITEQPQNSFWEKHKKKIKWGLVIAGVTIVGILVYKNKDTIASRLGKFWGQSSKETVAMQQSEVVETIITQHVDVPMHARNLPEGQKASATKLKQAAELGYKLAKNQTLVLGYSYERVA